jgi:hypothetical protein
MKRLIFLTLIIFQAILYAGNPPAERARGVFVAFGVGPRLPISSFSRSTDLGYGLNLELSYTDDKFLPMFLFARLGFEQYPGSQEYYEATAYSNYSTTSVPVIVGGRHYFSPMMENVFLFIPFVELAGALNYYSILHQFKIGSGRSNFTEDVIKFGFSGGVGISMFLMEILASYNFYASNQFIAVDFKVRLPLYINY